MKTEVINTEIKVLQKTTILGKEVTVYGTLENPLFLAKDVAEWIEYSKDGKGNYNVSAMINTVDEDEKQKVFTNLNNNKVGSNTWFLTEDGLYEIFFQSRKPIAKQFKRKVKQFLKELRKYGFTATEPTLENIADNPDLLIEIATKLKNERAEKERLAQQNAIQNAELQKQAPKVIFANAVEGSQSSCLIGELAKILRQNGIEMGQNRLFKWLRDNKYLGNKGERYNVPMQRYIEQGLFTLKKGVRSGNGGVLKTTITTKVTGKGQSYFINKFLTVA